MEMNNNGAQTENVFLSGQSCLSLSQRADMSLFLQQAHPFVWTTPSERGAVLANVNEPVWHHFLEEAENDFSAKKELSPPRFPVFCHDGDLDEVMAVAVLAFVRSDARLWNWVADWLRGALAFYREALPVWRENDRRILRGEPPPGGGNPRQFFNAFTRGGAHFSEGGPYWVEAGLMSVFLHLLDLLEAHAPDALTAGEKDTLLEGVADYALRYAFHEEAFKYNNRGMWANAGILLSAIAHRDPRAGALLRFQAARRHEEFRATFLDDGFHAEGAPDYHLMAADALLAYSLTASHLDSRADIFAGKTGGGFFEKYPSFVEIVRAYLRTVEPGKPLMNHPRGCSVYTPVTVRPALVQAWRLSGDPEIGWFLGERMAEEVRGYASPLRVTNAALLGLGQYQPLINFWLFRPVENARPPRRVRDVLPDFGGIFSRSGWHPQADCVTLRYGYEGTGKGHRDHAHVTATVGGARILKDPFPRFGPAALDSSPFHNTVTLDECEPGAVIGSLQAEASAEGREAFLIVNRGGTQPDRIFLHDPREETNYWFTNHPETPDFAFQRAILHLKDRGLVMVDRISAERPRVIDWFFHSDFPPSDFDPAAEPRFVEYQLRQRNVVTAARTLRVPLRGSTIQIPSGGWHEVGLGTARLRLHVPGSDWQIDQGRWTQHDEGSAGGQSFAGEVDHFLRVRTKAQEALGVWVVSWPDVELPCEFTRSNGICTVKFSDGEWRVDFEAGSLSLTP
jgi:hypothetical protein